MEDQIRFYVENRIREMGYKTFHFYQERQVRAIGADALQINATNEFWILFDVNQLTDDFTIEANNRTVTQAGFDANGLPYITYELTGDIIISGTVTAEQVFLFYRIIPD